MLVALIEGNSTVIIIIIYRNKGKKIQTIREFEHVSCRDHRGNETLLHCLVIRIEFLGIALCIPGLNTEFHRSRYSGNLLFNVLVILFQVCSV